MNCCIQKLYRRAQHIFYVQFTPPTSRVGYKVIGKNMAQPDKPQTAIYDACAFRVGSLRLQTHSSYVILLALARKKQLHDSVSILHLYYIACLVKCNSGELQASAVLRDVFLKSVKFAHTDYSTNTMSWLFRGDVLGLHQKVSC